MSATVTIFVGDVPHATYKWPAVPGVGDQINLDFNFPGRLARVRHRTWYRNAQGECQVDLRCERCE